MIVSFRLVRRLEQLLLIVLFCSTGIAGEYPTITVLYDNNPYTEELQTAWGFSCLITGTEKTILFDTGGNGSLLLENMRKLGIKPDTVDLIVLSHIHWDHIGGVMDFLRENNNVTVYLPHSFPSELKGNIMDIGAEVIEVSKPVKICEDVYSTGELGFWIKEQSLILSTDKGLIIITGCAHPGVANVVKKAKKLLGMEVLCVLGGFHLCGKNSKEIRKILSKVKKEGVRYTAPCHCSGDLARKLFKDAYGENFIRLGVGKQVDIGKLQGIESKEQKHRKGKK